MNLIEALRKANGKPVSRCRGELSIIMGACNSLCWLNPTGDSTIAYGMSRDDIFADDWCVVEPKSPIEEAIERECQTGDPIVILSRFQASQAMRRIVNLTLDEAKDQLVDPKNCGKNIADMIDSLKVRE